MGNQKFTIIKCDEPYIEFVDMPESNDEIVSLLSNTVKCGDCDIFERVPFPSAKFQMWVNDSGLIIPGARQNIVASILFGKIINCGCVLTGLDDKSGEILGLPDNVLIFMKDLQSECNTANDCMKFMKNKMISFLYKNKIKPYQ